MKIKQLIKFYHYAYDIMGCVVVMAKDFEVGTFLTSHFFPKILAKKVMIDGTREKNRYAQRSKLLPV